MDFVGQIGVAGKLAEISPAGKWWAAVPKNEWNLEDPNMIEDVRKNWTEPYGDRRQEIVIIGTDIDKESITKRIENCLLTDDELQLGPDEWKLFPDPIQPWNLAQEEEEEVLTH